MDPKVDETNSPILKTAKMNNQRGLDMNNFEIYFQATKKKLGAQKRMKAIISVLSTVAIAIATLINLLSGINIAKAGNEFTQISADVTTSPSHVVQQEDEPVSMLNSYVLNGDFVELLPDDYNLIENGDFQDGYTEWVKVSGMSEGTDFGNPGNPPPAAVFGVIGLNELSQTFTVDEPGTISISYDISIFFASVRVGWDLILDGEIVHSEDQGFVGGNGDWRTETFYETLSSAGEYTLLFRSETSTYRREAQIDNVVVQVNGGLPAKWDIDAGMSPGKDTGNPSPAAVFGAEGEDLLSQTFMVDEPGTITISYDVWGKVGNEAVGWDLILDGEIIHYDPPERISIGQQDRWVDKTFDKVIPSAGQYTLLFKANRPYRFENAAQLDNVIVLVNGEGPRETKIEDPYVLAPNKDSCSGLGGDDLADTQAWPGDPINSRNGNLSYKQTDLAMPILGCVLKFQRYYASDAIDMYSSTMGHGWTHNYDMRLHFTNTTVDGTIEVQAHNGSRFPFYDNGDGTFSPYPGIKADLVFDGTHYVITGFNQKVYTFDSEGKLLEKSDPNGNAIIFAYDANGRLETASQGSRLLTYVYDANGRLSTVTDNLGRDVELGYSDDNNLTVVTNTLELETHYYYSATQPANPIHYLTEVVAPSGETVNKTAYDQEGRANQQWDGAGNLLIDIDFSQENIRVVTENGL